MIIKTLILFITLMVTPVILGEVFRIHNEEVLQKIIFNWITGFWIMLSSFTVFSVMAYLLKIRFHRLVIIYSYFLLMCVILSICFNRKAYKLFVEKIKNVKLFKHKKYTVCYLAIFSMLLIFQIYKILVGDLSQMAADDATYVVYASQTVSDDYIYMTDVMGGTAISYTRMIYGGRLFQMINIFPAYISLISGISVPILFHTVLAAIYLLMAYGASYLLTCEIIKELDNRFIFMILMSFCYIFGLYSIYSTSFRMLGPIWQGKALLAVVFLPYLLMFYCRCIQDEFRWNYVLLLLCISIDAISLTMGGVVTMLAVSSILLLNKRNSRRKNIIYFIFSNLIPVGVGLFYIFQSGKITL